MKNDSAPGHGSQWSQEAGHHAAAPAKDTQQVTDPVCGMAVDPHTTPHRATHGGHTFYFCSAGC